MRLEIAEGHADRIELAAGKDVFDQRLEFRALAQGLLDAALVAPGDGVVQIDAARLEQAMNGREIGGVVGQPEMLEHADRRDLVEGAGQLGIGLYLDGDAILQSLSTDALAGELSLGLRQRDAMAYDAVVFRGMDEHGSPAAADVEQLFARLQPELAADMIELVFLRLVDAVGEIGEIAAAIDHAFIEEEPVEGVRNIVVMLDRLPVRPADEGVAPGKVGPRRHLLSRKQHGRQVAQDRELGQRLQLRPELAVRRQSVEIEQRPVFHVDGLGDPHFDQRREVGPAHHLPDDVLVVDGDHRAGGGADSLAVPQPDRETRLQRLDNCSNDPCGSVGCLHPRPSYSSRWSGSDFACPI